jgi:hypothetical protein
LRRAGDLGPDAPPLLRGVRHDLRFRARQSKKPAGSVLPAGKQAVAGG